MHPPNCHRRQQSGLITDPLIGFPCSLSSECSINFYSLHAGSPAVSAGSATSSFTTAFHFVLQQHLTASLFLVNRSSLSFLYVSSSLPSKNYLLRFSPKANCSKNSPWITSPCCPFHVSLPCSHSFLWMILLLLLLHISVSFVPQPVNKLPEGSDCLIHYTHI